MKNFLVLGLVLAALSALLVVKWFQSDPAQRETFWPRLRERLTAQPVLLLFLGTFLVVAYLNPAKIGLLLWGISKLAAFAFAGNWIDERLFKKSQPDNLSGIEEGTAWKRKSLIVAAAIVASALVP